MMISQNPVLTYATSVVGIGGVGKFYAKYVYAI